MGSMESSDSTKRSLAGSSLAHNLKNKLFCELFPELELEVQAELQRRTLAVQETIASVQNGVASSEESIRPEASQLQNALKNMCVLLCVAAFAYVVNHVLKSL